MIWQGALGAAKSQPARAKRTVEDSDSDFEMGENKPPHMSAAARRAAAKPRAARNKQRMAISDDEDADEYSGESDLEEASAPHEENIPLSVARVA